MFQLLLIIVKDLGKEEDEDDQEKVPMIVLTMWLWEKKEVDRGCTIMYKAICDNCKGNGYINITNSKDITEPKQCWMCNAEGEIKYEEDFVSKLITNHRHRLQ
jgi:DnaJ-class molecular chaperone